MQPGENSGSPGSASWGYYAFAFTVAILALLPRLGMLSVEPGAYLWAEDGTVFLNEAQEMGLAAIFHPYAGYLHFYPRIFSALSQAFSLATQPIVLLIGWCVAYLIMMYAVIRVAAKTNRSILATAVLVSLVSLQPNRLEVFFNITNSQWMIGAALFIFTLIESDGSERRKQIKGMLLLPLALTGPFSLVLTPVLLLRLLLKKDWAGQKYDYIPVFFGAFVQACALLSCDRKGGVANKDPSAWLDAFSKLTLFGADSAAILPVPLLIWSLLGYLVYAQLRAPTDGAQSIHPAYLKLIAALVLLVAGVYARKHALGEIIVLGGGNRYTWVPYALILLAGFLLTKGRRIMGPLLALLATLICIAGFHQFDSPYLQFAAYERFSRIEQVYIPLNPVEPEFPGWHVLGKPRTAKMPQGSIIELNLQQLAAEELNSSIGSQGLEIAATGKHPSLTTTRKFSCPNSGFAGLNIHLNRDEEGWLQLFWDEDGNFNEKASIPRWYPAGNITAQFAFPMPPGGVRLRFAPMKVAGHAMIGKIELHCL